MKFSIAAAAFLYLLYLALRWVAARQRRINATPVTYLDPEPEEPSRVP